MTGRRARVFVRVPPAVVRLGARQLGGRCLDPELPFETQRSRLDRLARTWLVPRGTTVAEQVVGGVAARVVLARRASAKRTVVHFHGGGYSGGSPLTGRSWAAHLSATADCQVVLPEYRLAPEHPYPAALEDARAVVAALAAQAGPGSLGSPATRQAAGGPRARRGTARRRPGAAGRLHPAVAVAGPEQGPAGRA